MAPHKCCAHEFYLVETNYLLLELHWNILYWERWWHTSTRAGPANNGNWDAANPLTNLIDATEPTIIYISGYVPEASLCVDTGSTCFTTYPDSLDSDQRSNSPPREIMDLITKIYWTNKSAQRPVKWITRWHCLLNECAITPAGSLFLYIHFQQDRLNCFFPTLRVALLLLTKVYMKNNDYNWYIPE